MVVDARMERLYERVTLVKGAGTPEHGRLCVMSFVALLSGEGHSDNPSNASRVIRRLAVTINDQMPRHIRQTLKPFAPRIIGTNDGLDGRRVQVLLDALRNDVFPRICSDFSTEGNVSASLLLARFGERATIWKLHAKLSRFMQRAGVVEDSRLQEVIASATADIIGLCARAAPSRVAADWYWGKAVELLDRLCDVADERAEPAIDTRRVLWLEQVLARRDQTWRRWPTAGRALERVRTLLPLW